MNDEMKMKMFLIKCSAKISNNGALDIEFNIGVDNDTYDFFKLLGKQKEYKQYTQKIVKTFNQIAVDLNDVTFNFFEHELNDEKIITDIFYENLLNKISKGNN